MKLMIDKICVRFMNQFSINKVKLLNNISSLRSLCSSTSVVNNSTKKLVKPNLHVTAKKKKVSSKDGIGAYGYGLLSIPAVTFLLGTWQVQRRNWKLNLIENMQTRVTREPIELPSTTQEVQSLEYYPVKVKGKFLYEKEFIIGPRNLIIDGKAAESNSSIISNKGNVKGYYVITPFKLSDKDLTILVNRGWIPKQLKDPTKRQEYQVKGEMEIVGIIRLNETRPAFYPKSIESEDAWLYRSVNEMAKRADTSAIYIDMIHDKNFPKYPVGGQTTVQLRNEHLSYIVTWYSLSALTGYFWYKQILRKVPIRR